jgi:hypothetical protein
VKKTGPTVCKMLADAGTTFGLETLFSLAKQSDEDRLRMAEKIVKGEAVTIGNEAQRAEGKGTNPPARRDSKKPGLDPQPPTEERSPAGQTTGGTSTSSKSLIYIGNWLKAVDDGKCPAVVFAS